MNTASRSRRLLSITGLLLFALVMTLSGRAVAAQDAMPGTSCATALGIGNEGDACISVVHSSPDAPLVDIYVDGELALSGLGFGWWSNWIAVPAGEHRVQVTANGTPADAAVIDATLTLEADTAYQVAATGFVAEIAPQVYQADVSELADDTARIRVVHTVPDAPAVDIAITGGDVLVSGLEFPNASDYLEVPADAYDLEVRPTGTMDVALELPGVELEAGMVYDVFAIGQLGDESLTVLVIPSTTMAPEATPAS